MQTLKRPAQRNLRLHAEWAVPTSGAFAHWRDARLAEKLVAAVTFDSEIGEFEANGALEIFLFDCRCHSNLMYPVRSNIYEYL